MTDAHLSTSNPGSDHYLDVSVDTPGLPVELVDKAPTWPSGSNAAIQDNPNFFPAQDELVAGQSPSIWSTYVKTAEAYDRNVVEKWNSDMDVLLVFAGLFTAVVTTLVVNVIGDLSENYSQTSAQLLRVLIAQIVDGATEPSPIPPVFQGPDPTARFVNIVWFLSIICSVGASTGAMLCKLWCTKFRNTYEPIAFPEEYSVMARKRQKKFDAMASWSMGKVVNAPLALLHIAVALFFLGLWKYLKAKDQILGYVVGIAVVVVAAVYLFFTLHPLFADTPFSTPFTSLVLSIVQFIVKLLLIERLLKWTSQIFNAPSLWSWAETVSNRWRPLKAPMFYLLSLLKPFVLVYRRYQHSALHGSITSLFKKQQIIEKQTELEINALVWLLHMPLRYADVREALKSLLDLATLEAAELIRKGRLVDCIDSCLRSIIHDGRIVQGKHDLAYYCVRILAFNQSMLINPPRIPDDYSAAMDELIDLYPCNTDENARLLSGSLWLIPSNKRGEDSFHLANRNLVNATLSDSILINLIRDAHKWLITNPASSKIRLDLDFDALEKVSTPSIKVIRALLPYFSSLLLLKSDQSITDDIQSMSVAQLIRTSLTILREQNRAQWMCRVISEIWRHSPHSLDESIANILFDWVDSIQTGPSDLLLPLLGAITHGPKVTPTKDLHPLTTLACVYKHITDGKNPISERMNHIDSSLVKAYAATFEHAFTTTAVVDFSAVESDFRDSHKLISIYLNSGDDDSLHGLQSLWSNFSTIVLSPTRQPDLTDLIVESFHTIDKQQNSRPELVRWVCSIIRVVCHRYSGVINKTRIADTLISSARRTSHTCTPEILQLKMEAIIHGPKVSAENALIPPLMDIANIHELILSRFKGSNDSQVEDLRNKILNAYASIIETMRLNSSLQDDDPVRYSQDVWSSITIMTSPLKNALKENRKCLLLTVYSLTILFWHLSPSQEDIAFLMPYREILVDLLTGISGLTGDPDDIEDDLDIKFYCSDLLANIFAFHTVRSVDRRRIRQILPRLETISTDDHTPPRLRWKAIYTVVQMTWYYDPGWHFDMRLTCDRIKEDVIERISRKEKFAVPDWEDVHLFDDCGLATTMRKIPRDLYLKDSAYNWQKGIPLLRFDRPPLQPQQRHDPRIDKLLTNNNDPELGSIGLLPREGLLP